MLLDYLKENRELDKIGGESYLIELTSDIENTTKSAQLIDVCSKIIKEKALLRKIQEKCVSILGKCRVHDKYSVEDLEKEIFELRSLSLDSSDDIYSEFGGTCRQTVLDLTQNPEIPISTGFIQLDNVLKGLYKKQLTVLAADTSMGKSVLALQVFINSSKNGHKCAYLTLEMTKQEMSIRALQLLTGIPFYKIRTMNVSSQEFQQLSDAIEYYEKLKCVIADKNVTIHEIIKTTRKLKDENKIDLIVIDHLHFITSTKRHENKAIEIDTYAKELKAMAKDLDISVLLLSHINRSSMSQVDRRPSLKDLKDSSGIAQHADNVFFIYRDGIYNKEVDPSLTEIIIDKNRNGERNKTVNLIFDGITMSFKEEFTHDNY
jgi:replicative DNA helicase